ncbi:cation:proton antiporter, partial [Methylibium sp. T29]
MHDLTLIVTLAGGLAFALLLGTLTRRLGLSTLVGYMLAGIVVGPNTPGFVADQSLASQLSEIGVILLMFGVGQHFHPQELLRVWRLAVPGAVAQSLVAGVAGW